MGGRMPTKPVNSQAQKRVLAGLLIKKKRSLRAHAKYYVTIMSAATASCCCNEAATRREKGYMLWRMPTLKGLLLELPHSLAELPKVFAAFRRTIRRACRAGRRIASSGTTETEKRYEIRAMTHTVAPATVGASGADIGTKIASRNVFKAAERTQPKRTSPSISL